MSNFSIRYKLGRLHKMSAERESKFARLVRNSEKIAFYPGCAAFGLPLLSLAGVIVKILLR